MSATAAANEAEPRVRGGANARGERAREREGFSVRLSRASGARPSAPPAMSASSAEPLAALVATFGLDETVLAHSGRGNVLPLAQRALDGRLAS